MEKKIKTKMYKNYSEIPSFTMEGDMFKGLNEDEYEVEVIIKRKNEKLDSLKSNNIINYYNDLENGIVILIKREGKVYGSTNKHVVKDMSIKNFTKYCKERLRLITDEIKEVEDEENIKWS